MLDLFLWVTIGMSYLFAAISWMISTSPNNPYSVHSLYVMVGIGLSIGTLGLVAQGKRDLYGVCLFTTVTGLILAIISGAIKVYSTEPHPIAVIISVIGIFIMIASVAYLVWCQYGTDKVPNILCQMFNRSAIYETEGVQFVALHNGKQITAGDYFTITLFMQNCWNIERTARLSLHIKRNNGLICPAKTTIVLPAGAVIKVCIPIGSAPNAKGHFSLSGGLYVNSRGGSRVRRWHAQAHTPPVSAATKGIALLGGVLVWGGGIRIEGNIVPSRSTANSETISKTETEIIWAMNGSSL